MSSEEMLFLAMADSGEGEGAALFRGVDAAESRKRLNSSLLLAVVGVETVLLLWLVLIPFVW